MDPAGLPGRPWFQNLVYAPGTLTGYGAKTLPGVREAIEQRRFDDARDLCRAAPPRCSRIMPTASTPRWQWRRCRMNLPLSTGRMIELAAAVLILAAGIYFYRRRDAEGRQLRQPGRGDPVRRRRDHGASTRSAGSIITRARPKPTLLQERGTMSARPPRLPLTTACAATQAAGAVAADAPGFLARPVARPHLPARLAGVLVRVEHRDLRRAQQRRLVRFRLFPRHRRVRRRREEDHVNARSSPRPVAATARARR